VKTAKALAFAALAYGTDICSKWPTCDTCLNVTSEASSSSITDIADAFGANVGSRAHCGWCNLAVWYADGTRGKQCVDIDTKFKCESLFNTSKCDAGYLCNCKCQTEAVRRKPVPEI
jgi:hypothetical protein